MGGSRWSDDDYRSYAQTTNYRAASAKEVFSSNLNKLLDPRNVKVGKGDRVGQQLRESIISPENPNPTPIILGLDVTGSMGQVAVDIAKNELPKLMTQIHATKAVVDPHVMFMGIDDVFAQGHGALQVSYFEPDLKIVEQLRQMWIVGNGGGNGSESYDLAWYFAGRYTYLENFEKNGRKGFLFTFGDEPAPYQTVSASELRTIFGPGDYESAAPAQSLKSAQQKYQVFHVHVDHGRPSRSTAQSWTDLLGNNALFLRDPAHLTEVVLATMRIADGADMNSVIAESSVPSELKYAFQNAMLSNQG